MRNFFRFLTAIFAVIFGFIITLCVYSFFCLPSKYIVTSNSTSKIKINKFLKVENTAYPVFGNKVVFGKFKNKESSAFSDGTKNILFLNFIPVKKINLEYKEEQKVVPCGTPFGVKIFTQGVLVVGTSDVKSEKGFLSPAKNAGIKKGDVILSVNNNPINSNEDLFEIVENSAGNVLSFQILRNNLKFDIDVEPLKNLADNKYKLGAWVRDSSAGIGTLTFHSPQTNIFGGLGHGICDIDTGDLLPLSHGDIVKASINGIIKGQKGIPGELKGYFIETQAIGKLLKNTDYGVYGTLKEPTVEVSPVVVATKQDVKIGPAQIITTVNGTFPKTYSVYIQNVNYNENSPCKNIIIKITDDDLLCKTGGIIQGMSGSPLIQGGKLVGAVTHVFINDPSKGYAIFAENMVYGSSLPVSGNSRIKKAS